MYLSRTMKFLEEKYQNNYIKKTKQNKIFNIYKNSKLETMLGNVTNILFQTTLTNSENYVLILIKLYYHNFIIID